MRQVPDPEHDEWLARMREVARHDAEDLVPRPLFEVLELAAPSLRPVALIEAMQVREEWTGIGLAYGNWADPAGPWVSVTSATVMEGPPGSGAEGQLLWAIDDERNRLADQACLDEEDPADPPEYWPASVPVGDGDVRGLACRHGNLVAVQLPVGAVTVTVIGRGVDPVSVQLAVVTDLGPYENGRHEMLEQVAERRRSQPEPVLEPAQGMAAYRALVDAELEWRARTAARLNAGRIPRHRVGEGPRMGALWQRAVRELADRSGIGDRQADDTMTSVVNQLTALDEKGSWFSSSARLRERAIDETLRYATLGEQVASAPAQLAWQNSWGYHTNMAVQHGQFADIALRHGKQFIDKWLDAWEKWTLRQLFPPRLGLAALGRLGAAAGIAAPAGRQPPRRSLPLASAAVAGSACPLTLTPRRRT
ncbi:MAG TPA: hypothetical protein VF070_08445 [Streptosporangiaceae bacterium]